MELGLEVELRLCDYRDVEGQFDAICSVEMIEAVGDRYWDTFFTALDQATSGRNPQEAVIEAFALGVRLVQDSPLYSRIAESEPELFGMFSKSHVFPIGQFADGIARTLRSGCLGRG